MCEVEKERKMLRFRHHTMKSLAFLFLKACIVLLALFPFSLAGIPSESNNGQQQPLNPGAFQVPNTVPAFPVQTATQNCHLDLSDELFGGVGEACGRNLDRSRCCPVLAAWLFAAHAQSALQISAPAPASSDLPMIPDDDSQKCVNSLQNSLLSHDIHIPQPNSTCDAILCFCGIRLHQISSLSCPAAFNVSAYRNATPKAAVRDLERNCRNSSYAGCTRCLESLEKLKGGGENRTSGEGNDRASKMFSRDCQLMGLTWLLARNKTAYIPTVSAVLRAIMYSAHPPHQSKCSPDQENMPLAVDSLQFQKLDSSIAPKNISPFLPLLPPIILFSLCTSLFL
ncbi:putative GPI-anchored protein At4g28100 [Tasmannia lanceolata]|uniref:putative GPI-anchored protein At4g28100 n=1 Tax=Tasmannia lanceolata TaxID=3420 RepID=UPI0040640D80